MTSMQLTYDDALLACARQCSTFAYEHCRDVNCCSELIILSLDCTELCRQASMHWRRKSERTRAVALQCIEVCNKLTRHLTDDVHGHARQLLEYCLKARRCCSEIVAQPWVSNHLTNHSAATVCYGITLPVSIYQA